MGTYKVSFKRLTSTDNPQFFPVDKKSHDFFTLPLICNFMNFESNPQFILFDFYVQRTKYKVYLK
jgi:hypothetical protein